MNLARVYVYVCVIQLAAQSQMMRDKFHTELHIAHMYVCMCVIRVI